MSWVIRYPLVGYPVKARVIFYLSPDRPAHDHTFWPETRGFDTELDAYRAAVRHKLRLFEVAEADGSGEPDHAWAHRWIDGLDPVVHVLGGLRRDVRYRALRWEGSWITARFRHLGWNPPWLTFANGTDLPVASFARIDDADGRTVWRDPGSGVVAALDCFHDRALWPRGDHARCLRCPGFPLRRIRATRWIEP